MTRPLDLADELAQLVNPLPQQDLDPEAAALGDGDLLNAAPLDPQLEALLGDAGATAGASAGRRRGVAADIALDGGAYRGRVSSRAALFGNGDDAGSSSADEGSSSEGQDNEEQQQQQQQQQEDGVQERGRPQFTSPSRLRVVAVSPDRDLSRYKTMFVNGHHHPGAPGKDDTTDDSSSTDSDSDDSQQQDEQQQMNGHHHDQQDLQAQQQEHVSIGQQQQQDRQVSPVPRQQQQPQQQQASPAASSGSGEGSEEDEQPPPADGEQQQQQQRHTSAAAAADGPDGEEGSKQDEELEEGSESSEQQDEQQRLAGQQSGESEGSEGEGEEGGDSGSEQEGEDADEADGMDVDAPATAAAAAADGGDGEVDRVAAAAAAAAMLGEAAEMQELEREAAAVRAEAEQQLVAAAAGGDRQAAKAAGVRAQQRLWGNALELRIRLQKAVNGANRLPRPAAAAAFRSGNSQVDESYKQLQAACQETLETMLQLHDALAQQHPAAAAAMAAAAATKQQQEQQPAAAAAGTKRSRSAAGVDGEDGSKPPRKYTGVCSSAAAAWSAVEGAIESMAGFRDASLDKWHRRTVLSSGTAALRGSSGLRALQQSISIQVSQLMSADRAKLIARSQLPVQLAPRPLGQPSAAAADSQQQQEGADEDGGGARGSERARDAETYDEGDFYSQLLKELLESAPAGSVPSQLASARPAKRRKVVDRRASKGRKLRFHTMDKLVGFMAPKEMVLPPFAEQLFGNLFSHEG